MEGTKLPVQYQTETVAPSREGKNLVTGMEAVNSPIESQTELVTSSSEGKSSDMGTEGANSPENQTELVASSNEAKSLDMGTEGAMFRNEYRIEPLAPSWEAKTLVLFGRVGNGKSALGNSILRKKEFVSKISASGVTTISKLGTTMLEDGQVVNVIDTPGLFDLSKGSDSSEYLAKEMVNCITLAKDGIHGFILVCSIKTRFSIEEEGVIHSLGKIFGKNIYDYMVVVFTGGDELDTPFPDYISACPSSLQTVLQLCKHRVVLFDNRTKDEDQRKNQVQQLMKCVGKISDENGQPYKSETFERMKKEALGKHEANTPMMHSSGVQKSHTAQQKSSVRGYGNETSREKKVLVKEPRKGKKTSPEMERQ